MSCFNLLYNRDYTCKAYKRKYLQKIVLVRDTDVSTYKVYNDEVGSGRCLINIEFTAPSTLKVLSYNANANIVFGSFDKSIKNDLVQYKHKVQLSVFDVSQQAKVVLRSLDNAKYFALLMYENGVIEVYGFHNGLRTANYEYNPANNSGGGWITLESVTEEYVLPYVLATNFAVKNIFQSLGLGFFDDDDLDCRDIDDELPVDITGRFGTDFGNDFN